MQDDETAYQSIVSHLNVHTICGIVKNMCQNQVQ